jgi:hypothetical protein
MYHHRDRSTQIDAGHRGVGHEIVEGCHRRILLRSATERKNNATHTHQASGL